VPGSCHSVYIPASIMVTIPDDSMARCYMIQVDPTGVLTVEGELEVVVPFD
jgi:hypothetical protein